MIERQRIWRRVVLALRSRWQWCAKQISRQLRTSMLLLLCFAVSTGILLAATQAETLAATALPVASIHTYQERPGQTTFRSKQSLRDRKDRSWQVILFKRYQADSLQGLYLRLVGFPGLVTLDETQSLTVATGSSLQWDVQPALDPQTSALPDYAGQYDVANAIAELSGDIPLQIDIPLGGGGTAQLVVPPFAVHEWRELAAQSPAA